MRLREIEGSADGSGLRIGIAVSTFNETITGALLDGAVDALEGAGVEECTVVRVPGALELGTAIQRLVADHDAVLTIETVADLVLRVSRRVVHSNRSISYANQIAILQ